MLANGICVDKMKKENNYLQNVGEESKVTWKAVTFFLKFNYVSHCAGNLNIYYFP